VEDTYKEVASTLIKLRTLEIIPLKIKEKTPAIGRIWKSSMREITDSQETPKLITPISSTIVNLEDSPSPTKIPSRAQEEGKVATPPTNYFSHLTLSELEVATGLKPLDGKYYKRIQQAKKEKAQGST
jgi:hypothetical protein